MTNAYIVDCMSQCLNSKNERYKPIKMVFAERNDWLKYWEKTR